MEAHNRLSRGPLAGWRDLPGWAVGLSAVAALLLVIQFAVLAIASRDPDLADSIAEGVAFVAESLMVAGFLAGVVHTQGERRRSWQWFAAAGTVYLLGEVSWTVQVALGEDPSSHVTIADACWLLAFPLFYVALHYRIRTQARPLQRGEGLVESLIVMAVFAIVLWELVLRSAVASGESPLVAAVTIAYPVGDLGLLWMVLRGIYRRSGRWDAESSLLAGGLVALAAGDTVWAVGTANYVAQGDFLYLAFALMLGAAGFIAGRTREHGASHLPAPRPLLFDLMPYLAGIVVALVPIWQAVTGRHHLDIALIAVGVLLLIFVRLWMTVRQNRLLREGAEQAALTDGLTGLRNHRYFEERLEQELSRARREGGTVGLLMIDIDEFKRVNDSAGHLAGDQLLRDLGDLLRATCRPSDTPCRVGGDELAVLAPGATLPGLVNLARRILDGALGIEIAGSGEGGDEGPVCSVSVGACLFPDQAEDAAALSEGADAALYHSKRAGRGRASAYDPSAEEPGSAREALAAAEAAARVKELDFRGLFDAAREPMLILGDTGKILDANPAAGELTGLTPAELIGGSIFDFALDGGTDEMERMRQSELSSGYEEGEHPVRLPDGSIITVEFSATVFSPGRHLLVLRDVTDRRAAEDRILESEQKFRSLFEHAADAIYITDDNGKVVDANQAAIELSGIARRDLVGSSIADLVAPGEQRRMDALQGQLRANGSLRGVYEGVWPDGTRRAVEYTGVANFIPGHHLSIVRDVTPGREVESEAAEQGISWTPGGGEES